MTVDPLNIIRRTKIIATIGPATSSSKAMEALLLAGVDVVRLNLSHGDHADHAKVVETVRKTSERLGLSTGILADLCGPKIRTGQVRDGAVALEPGDKLTITTDDIIGGDGFVSTTYKDLPGDVSTGGKILIDDGLIELRITSVDEKHVDCEVVYGGTLKNSKGINLPGVKVSAPSLSEKDIKDIAFAVEAGVDFFALSFVRKRADVEALKTLLKESGAETAPVIAKIENAEAVENLEEILESADGVMVARGDLGVELYTEKVPVLQKEIITRGRKAGKTVITATQMLESMINAPRPTRAEASDVANAVFDGTSAVMLSGETAVGEYPSLTVETMVRIIKEAESAIERKEFMRRNIVERKPFADAVTFAAYAAAGEVNSKVIVVFTQTGDSAILLSKLRPKTPIIAFTLRETTRRRLSITWGVNAYTIDFGSHTDEMICRGEAELLNLGLCNWGDAIVIVSGTRVGMRGATNMMKIDWLGSNECKLYLNSNE